MNEDCPRKKVAIEDLLSLKRAERPPAEFWHRFERELRAKQLAAIVEKRAWWQTFAFPRSLRGLMRIQLPVGAFAILAITMLSVQRQHRVSSSDETSVQLAGSPLAVAEVGHVTTAVMAAPTLSHIVSESDTSVASSSDEPIVPAKIAPGFAPTREESAEDSALNLTAVADLMPSLSESRPTDSTLVASLSYSTGFESRVLPARSQSTDPLAQVATPKSVRLRDRYLGGALPAGYSIDSAGVSSERPVTRLQDRQLRPEEFSRFDARGNSLSIKL